MPPALRACRFRLMGRTLSYRSPASRRPTSSTCCAGISAASLVFCKPLSWLSGSLSKHGDPVDWRGFFDERAGIAEHDSGLPREEAEARALDCCVAEWLLRTPIGSSPDRCLECGKSARIDELLLAIGVVGARLAWLHRDCVPAWHSTRKAAAVSALSAMNIVVPAGVPVTPEETKSASKATGRTGQIGSEN